MSLASGTRLGPYEIVAPLGAGGMGEVFRARDTKLNRDVAIKILPEALASDPAARARFEREAQAIAALSHPNILGIFDFGIDRGMPYAVTELLEGGTLRDALGTGGRANAASAAVVPPRKAIEFAQQLAAGLGAAHAQGIVHRDLKPENVFVTRDGRIKILDFGLAKVTPAATSAAAPSVLATSPALTGAGTILGTVGYMAPEQVRGHDVDQRADIFAFGAILYELLSGQRAFTGDSAVETMNAILTADPPELARSNAALPPAFERIVRRCLEKNPDERFQSARDVAFALDAVSTTRSDASAPALDPPSKPRSNAWRAVIAAILVAAAAGIAGFIAGSSRRATPPRLTRLTFERGTIRSARFAPDGKTIVYGGAWGGRPFRVFQTRLGSPESVPLQLPDADILSIAPTGELAIGVGRAFTGWIGTGKLARAPLVGGIPRDVLDEVSDADWAPAGDALAIVRRVDGRDRLEYPMGKVLYETTGYVDHVRFSTSGDALAVLDHPVYGDNRGWVSLVTPTGERRRLTREWAGIEGLAWSPDGREIWYTAGDNSRNALRGVARDGVDREIWSAPADLAILDTAQDGRVLLTTNSGYNDVNWLGPGEAQPRDISWFSWSVAHDVSADGRGVLLNRFDEGAGIDYQIGLRRMEASGAVALGAGSALQLSPDTKWALGLTYSDPPTLLVIPTGAGERRSLTTGGLKYFTAGWFPDGKQVLFVAESANGLAAYVQNVAGGAPQLVAPVPAMSVEFPIQVSPDGQWFFGRQASGTPSIIATRGGARHALPGLDQLDSPVAWTPDGHGLLVVRTQPDRSSVVIARLDLGTSLLTAVRTISVPDPSGVRALSLVVTPDARTVVYNVQRYITDLYLVEGLK